MTIKDCIDEAVAGGEMDASRGQDAKNLFDEIEREFLDELGPEGARIRAAQATVDQVKRETAARRRQAVLAMAAQRRILTGLEVGKQRLGLDDSSELAIGIIDRTGIEGLPFVGAEQLRKTILGRAHQRFNEGLANFRRTLIGTPRDKATLLNLVREAFGEDTGDAAAKAFAKTWYDTAEFLRKQFNAGGGTIGKLERWGMPQSHDTLKVRQASFEEWRDFIVPKLDRERMVDGLTGRPFSGERLELALRDVYETIRTDGFSKVQPSAAARGRSMANRRSDHRFLHFRTADDWLTYQDRFGSSDVFSSMMAHIDSMARDIGAMRALGPNPTATIRWLQETLRKEAEELQGAGRKVERSRNRLQRTAAFMDTLFDQYTGAVNAPADARVARFFQGLRSILTSAQLGSATLSATTDVNFGRIAAQSAGLNQARLLTRHLKLLTPNVTEDQKLAVRLGLIAENWSQVASAQMRYVGEVAGPEVLRRMSDGVLRVTGLSPWTQAGKWAFGMEFMGTLSDHSGRAFGDLPAPLRKTMLNYNIDEQAWNIIRRTDVFEPDRGGFIRPDDVAARDDISPELADDLATRMLAMVQTETEFAVPSASLRGRAFFGGNTRPGTLPGELLRSTLMYKNFSVTLYYTHLRRMAAQEGAFNKARYGANLFVSATLMGALALQMKEISKGRDPRQMFGDKAVSFWTAAMMQGGGLGIFGDFAFSDVNRFGFGFEQTVAGPVINFGTDLSKLTIGNLREVLAGDDTKAGAELTRFVKRYTPGASAWYARLALERMIFDRMELALDPDARRRFRRQEQRLNRELGTQFFFPRGAREATRAPDLGNALDGLDQTLGLR